MTKAPIILIVSISGMALGAPGDVERDADALARDAESRTSLLAGDVLQPAESSIVFGGIFQFRYVANVRDNEGAEESFTHGFSVARTQLWGDAQLNETWSFHFQAEFGADGGVFALQDAWADWELDDSWTLRSGQFKTPFSRERLHSDHRQLAVDRSVENSAFNLNRTQGIQAIYDSESWRAWFCFNTGASSINNDFNGASNADFAFTGRGEYRFAGDWDQLKDFSGWMGQEAAGSVGAAVHYQSGGSTGVGSVGSTVDTDIIAVTADVAYEGAGWSIFGALNWQNTDAAAATDSTDDFGALVQGGVFVSSNTELFGRYDAVLPDSDRVNDDVFNTITFGVNHYFIPESHASKLTVDLQWFLGSPADNDLVNANTSVGLLNSSNDSQFALRCQYQAAF
jgi:hypothetical protein